MIFMFHAEVVDDVAEMIGQKFTKSQIKSKLREALPELGTRVMEDIISLARQKIRALYKIDPMEYKGSSIEFYQYVIRNQKAELRLRILCQERLDKLLGLEHVTTDDPNVYASKIRAALEEANASVTGEEVKKVKVEEKHSSIFGDFSINDLDPALRELAVKLDESNE